MKGLDFNQAAAAYLELAPGRLRGTHGGETLDLPLERGAGGRLTTATREAAAAALQKLAGGASWKGRPRAYCAVPVRGVSLRRLTVAAASKEEFPKVLAL